MYYFCLGNIIFLKNNYRFLKPILRNIVSIHEEKLEYKTINVT